VVFFLSKDKSARFADRTQAGFELAFELRRYLQGESPFVLAVPPDGVPVAASISTELDTPMDIVVSRRMLSPGHEEETLGAITADRTLVVNRPLVSRLGLADEVVEQLSIPEWAEAQRAMQRYRRGRPYPNLAGNTVVIVDDGLTTGYTVMGAIISARKMEPERIVVAVPVSSLEAMERLRDAVDSILALEISSEEDYSVAQYYRHYAPITEQEVIWTLDHLWRDRSVGGYTETF
jgi:putative phosphoribosyl transferase